MTVSASEVRQIVREELTALLHPSIRQPSPRPTDQRAETPVTLNENRHEPLPSGHHPG